MRPAPGCSTRSCAPPCWPGWRAIVRGRSDDRGAGVSPRRRIDAATNPRTGRDASSTGASHCPASAIRGGPAAPRAAERRSWRDPLSRARSARPTPGKRSTARNRDASSTRPHPAACPPQNSFRRFALHPPWLRSRLACGAVGAADAEPARHAPAPGFGPGALRLRNPASSSGASCAARSDTPGGRPCSCRYSGRRSRGSGCRRSSH